jgi:phage terminase small subunit
MATKLTKKQKDFVKVYADTGNGTLAAKKAYAVTQNNDNTAAVIAHENLSKPKIIDALHKLGFNEDNAKSVVAEILNNPLEEGSTRLNAADKVFKTFGTYAAEKVFNLTANASVEELKEIIQKDLAKFRPNN